MALTKVGPAGIGSTPGNGITIGDSFLHTTGLDSTNAKFTGIVTAQTFRVLGNFQVDGTTTTLDTEVTSVDKLEVAANNTTVGVAITQSGSGDILNLYDGSTEVFSVTDGGNVGIKNATGVAEFAVDVGGEIASKNANKEFIGINLVSNEARIRSSFYSGASGAYRPITFYTSDTERLRITSDGKIGVGTNNPTGDLTISKANGAIITLQRDDTSTAGNRTLGEIVFRGNDNSGSYENCAKIRAISDKGHSDGDKPTNLEFHTTPDNSGTPVERLRITSEGLVGIGSVTPSENLDVHGKIIAGGAVYTNDDRGNPSRKIVIGSSSTYHLRFYNPSDTSQLQSVFKTDGKVGIGTDNPSKTLTLFGASSSSFRISKSGVLAYDHTFDGSSYTIANNNGSAGIPIIIGTKTAGGESLRIDSAGRIGIGGNGVGNGLGVYLQRSSPNTTHFYEASDGTKTMITGVDSTNDYVKIGSLSNHRVGLVANNGEKLSILPSGNIGIGNNGSFGIFTGANDRNLLLGTGSGSNGIQLHCSTTGYGGIYFGDSSSGNARYSGYVEYKNNENFFRIATSESEKLRITSDGDMGLGNSGCSNPGADPAVGNDATVFEIRQTTAGNISSGNNRKGAVLRLKHEAQWENGYQNSATDDLGRVEFVTGDSSTGEGVRSAIRCRNLQYYNNHALTFEVAESNSSTIVERLRITSAGNVTIGGKSNPNWASTVDALTIGYAGVLYEDSYTSGTDNYLILGNNTFYNASGGGNTYIRNDQAQRIMMQGGAWWFQNAGTGTAGNTITYTDRLRITNDGKVGINMSTPTFELDLDGRFRATHGSSGLFFEEINNGAALWLDGANGDFTGGDYYGIIANNSARLQFGYAGAAHMELNSTGQLYLGGYPHDHTVAGSSNLKLRAGAGAWGISIGMRASQNDYAYIGFTDMNGDEQIGDMFMQRTGTSTGHMVFSTNNGNTNSTNRMRIGPSGRLCVSPSANFTSESSSFVMTVVNNGSGSSGGYPGINIRSVATGGTTNSAPGMTLVSTDSNWTLYTASGNVHGLGILTGNSANSSNCAMYLRSDKKVITGPTTVDELDTATSSGTAFCVTGGGLSIGSLGNQGDTVQGGRNVIGWYMYRYNGSTAYAHLTTSLWGGGSPNGESMYMMGGFRIHGYRYSTSGVSEENIYFHNWSGGLPNYSRYHRGNWDPGNTAYVNSSGYVTLRLSNASYYGYDIDLIQHAWYPNRDIKVTNVTYNGNATI